MKAGKVGRNMGERRKTIPFSFSFVVLYIL